MTATFYGVGVGPGDPELITIKAWRLIGSGAVIAYPVSPDQSSLARSIAAPFIAEGAVELPIAVPMAIEREPAQAAYDAAGTQIADHLDAGRDVVFLCEGDPMFYASFMYMLQKLGMTHQTICVPGVTSLTAAAAAAGRPLAARNDILKVLPAPLDEADLIREIATADAVAIIKVGRHFDKIRRLLTGLDLIDNATIVEAATSEKQKITALAAVAGGEQPYFSTILIYKGPEPW